ncbi:DnaD domain protein [Alkalibacter rhizosphaerae]|uniref:DnaD domain protein n=1 Tax=Alkalibacter rhizosphaerae TaxID=2815577 RepID=A0A974XDA8_9FIRM|nr:DnaD domain protein [Alkalibacter rhizosphaerae]QSX07737.1 DnaD domain protein [Alkalibacter rhizosphaerae]
MNQFELIQSNDDLSVTLVENIFINHYMPKAPGDFVKVYLLGLKYCQSSNLAAISNTVIAKSLNLLESDVDKAWKFWEKEGILLVEEREGGHSSIRYFNIASLMLEGRSVSMPSAKKKTDENEIQQMHKAIEYMFARPLSVKELQTIGSWMEEFQLSSQAVTLLVEYCLEKDKKDINYMNRVATTWYDNGIFTYEDAKRYIESNNVRWTQYYQIMNYLGMNRQPSKAEIEFMDKWLDEYGFSLEMIFEGCRRMTGLHKPNFRYLNSVLTSWKEKGFTRPEDTLDEKGPATGGKSPSKDSEPSKYDYDLIQKKLREKMWGEPR